MECAFAAALLVFLAVSLAMRSPFVFLIGVIVFALICEATCNQVVGPPK